MSTLSILENFEPSKKNSQPELNHGENFEDSDEKIPTIKLVMSTIGKSFQEWSNLLTEFETSNRQI